MSTAAEQPRIEKLQQQAEELSAAVIRANTGLRDLRFRGQRLEIDGHIAPIRAAHLSTDRTSDDYRSFRGAADGFALRLQHSDPELHKSLMPEPPVEQMMFELLEQLRCEALVDDSHPGARQNMHYRYRRWCEQFSNSNMVESHIGLLVYTLAQSCWSRLTGQPVAEATEDLIEPHRMMLAPHIGGYLAGLRRYKEDQAKFAEQSLGIIEVLSSLVEMLDNETDEEAAKKAKDELVSNFTLMLNLGEGDFEVANAAQDFRASTPKQLAEQLEAYSVYTREFDREVHADKLVRAAQLVELREQLDLRIAGQGLNRSWLTRELRKMLAAPQRDGWNFGEEEGYLDGRRLASLITNPNDHALFKQERHQPHTDCSVTFLLDNSGSMKQHIDGISMMVDLFARALEQAGAKTEILGFTTGGWKGGKAYKKWQRAGSKPDNPGRLNEVHHVIYKDENTSWRRARPAIAAMLKPSLFRESIDGEAVLWASNRLLSQNTSRRILVVISDGCPMDSATVQTNEEDFLDNHLKQAAAMIENQGAVELYALGVGLDLSAYYRHNLALDLEHGIDNALFKEILQLISGRRGR